MLNFHEQLTKEFIDIQLPNFPPKKLFPLTNNQQEERRICLEKYIQTIGQNSLINNCDLLNGFLLNSQQETSGKISIIQDINIYLIKDKHISLKLSTSESTKSVLKKVCRTINLPSDYDNFFILFIVRDNDDDDKTTILRKLQNFESPLLTLNNINITNSKIVIGKNYWDVNSDIKLMNDSVSLNLLYLQAKAEIERGWIQVQPDYIDNICDFKNQENKFEYLKLAQSFKYYGYIQFTPCYCDYPKPETKVLVAIGKNELNLRILMDNDEEHEVIFKVTRMRCWRITTLHNKIDKNNDGNDYSLELSFEYLVAKNQLQWVTILSEQAILMSVSLQGMIDELLVKKIDAPRHRTVGKTWTYVMRDGHTKMAIKSSDDNDDNKMENQQHRENEFGGGKKKEQITGTKTKKDVKTTVKIDKMRQNDCDIMENNAFHMIGDDDL